MTGKVALVRALSKLGLASRTQAHALVDAGRVAVRGRVARDPLTPVSPERDPITIDGERARRPTPRLIAFHKPRGVVTTRRDPDGRQTVFDVLGPAGDGLQAVGRLDRASTGLLLLTNDTGLAHALTDPTRGVRRRYVVTVRGRLEPNVAATLEAGLHVERYRAGRHAAREHLAAAQIAIRKVSNRETHLIVDLTEGKNRELRRLFHGVGHEVTRIHRIAFGPHELGSLQPGEWREEPVHRT